MPVTFYHSLADLPAYENYASKGRGYRYFEGKAQYPFGYGLSYTNFAYSWVNKPVAPASLKDTIAFSIKLANTGACTGDEVVQVYIKYPPAERMPLKELKAFKRVAVEKDGTAMIDFRIPVTELQKWDLSIGHWKLYKGNYSIVVGGSSANEALTTAFTLAIK